jgi:RimJ/RimL family protein N-acetyltransferase
MVAFTELDPHDEAAFAARWKVLLADDSIVLRTVLVDGEVAGIVLRFDGFGRPEVGYWYGRRWWGRGVATAALRAFLEEVAERPLFGVVVHDNPASIRVLEKCGFVRVGMDRSFSTVRGVELDQLVLRLDA